MSGGSLRSKSWAARSSRQPRNCKGGSRPNACSVYLHGCSRSLLRTRIQPGLPLRLSSPPAARRCLRVSPAGRTPAELRKTGRNRHHPAAAGTGALWGRPPAAAGAPERTSDHWGDAARQGGRRALERDLYGRRDVGGPLARGDAGGAGAGGAGVGHLGSRDLPPLLSPTRVEVALSVHALVGVRAEVVAQALDQVCRQAFAPVAVVVSKRRREGGHRYPEPDGQRNDFPPGGLGAAWPVLKMGREHKFAGPRVLVVGILDGVKKARENDPPAAPDGR